MLNITHRLDQAQGFNITSAWINSSSDSEELTSELIEASPYYLKLAMKRSFNDFGNVEIQFYTSPDKQQQIVVIGQNDREKYNAFTLLGCYVQFWHTPCCTPEFFAQWMRAYGENTTLEGVNPDFYCKTGLRLCNEHGSTFSVLGGSDTYWNSLTATARSKINKIRKTFDHLTIEWEYRVPDISNILPQYLTAREHPVFPSFANIIGRHVEWFSVTDPNNRVMVVLEGSEIVAVNLARVVDGVLVDCTCVRSLDEKYSGIGVWCIAKNIDMACGDPEISRYSLGGAEVTYKAQFVPDLYRHMLSIPLGVHAQDSEAILVGQYQKGGLTGIDTSLSTLDQPNTEGFSLTLLKDLAAGTNYLPQHQRSFIESLTVESKNPCHSTAVRNNMLVYLDSLVLLAPSGRPLAMQGQLHKVGPGNYSTWMPFLQEQITFPQGMSNNDLHGLLSVAELGGGVNLHGILPEDAPDTNWALENRVHYYQMKGDTLNFDAMTPKQVAFIEALPDLIAMRLPVESMDTLALTIARDREPNDKDAGSYFHHINFVWYQTLANRGLAKVFTFVSKDAPSVELGYMVMIMEASMWVVADYWQPREQTKHMGSACLKALLVMMSQTHTYKNAKVVLTKPSRTGPEQDVVAEAFKRRFSTNQMSVLSFYATLDCGYVPYYSLSDKVAVLVEPEPEPEPEPEETNDPVEES